jgi:ribA/ribD-fused uncharacterized protein
VPEVIDKFSGRYSFLSNFYWHKFKYDGMTYRTAEHAFQAQKTLSLSERAAIKGADSPGAAKRMGRRVKIREGWDNMKAEIMEGIVRAKFKDPELRKLLVATGDAELIEGNHWGDTYWGVCNGHGRNQLGKILMLIRAEVR